VVQATVDELRPGNVVIRAAYSSVNYKDCAGGNWRGKILRRLAADCRIDVSGIVESSSDPRFTTGQPVLVTIRLRRRQRRRLRRSTCGCRPTGRTIPEGPQAVRCHAIGTAGFTAALYIVEMERNGLRPPTVRDRHGGDRRRRQRGGRDLRGLGYQITALTGKDDQHEYLRSLGARDVLSRNGCSMGTRPLEKIDCGPAPSIRGRRRRSRG